MILLLLLLEMAEIDHDDRCEENSLLLPGSSSWEVGNVGVGVTKGFSSAAVPNLLQTSHLLLIAIENSKSDPLARAARAVAAQSALAATSPDKVVFFSGGVEAIESHVTAVEWVMDSANQYVLIRRN